MPQPNLSVVVGAQSAGIAVVVVVPSSSLIVVIVASSPIVGLMEGVAVAPPGQPSANVLVIFGWHVPFPGSASRR